MAVSVRAVRIDGMLAHAAGAALSDFPEYIPE